MYCRFCGTQISEDDNFCRGCGRPIEKVEHVDVEEVEAEVQQEEQREVGPFKVFGIIGKVLSIIAISTVWFPFLGLVFGVYAIPLVSMGFASPSMRDRMGRCLGRSILASVLNIVLLCLYLIVLY